MNLEAVRVILREAQSMAPDAIKNAESILRNAESQAGFGYLLAQLVTRQDFPESDRQLSAILLRKFVKTHWDADAENFEVKDLFV